MAVEPESWKAQVRQWRPWRRIISIAVAILILVPGSAVAGDQRGGPKTRPEISVLSNRADLVSGGDALVAIDLPQRADPDDLRIRLNGHDIRDRFASRQDHRYIGLVTGLRMGRNTLTASLSNKAGSKLTITNHSLQGPIFSGDQIEPWICETEKSGLGPATGSTCVAPTMYEFFYKSLQTSQFETYDPGSPPDGSVVATTTTDEGKSVPYIVRRERGVINRGIFDVAVLFDPRESGKRLNAWNGKLHLYTGGGINTQHRQGGVGVPNVLSDGQLKDLPLSRGYAVASSSLLFAANNWNDIVAAETLMMMKEHFIEEYGEVRYTTASGGSSGAVLLYLIADNNPGLVDGIMPFVSAPDHWSFAGLELSDCDLLSRYFSLTPQIWARAEDRAAVAGEPKWAMCATPPDVNALDNVQRIAFDPTQACAGPPEPSWVYNPETNRRGVRCTFQDHMTNLFGSTGSEGFAGRPIDNSGVQYGLGALQRNEISAEQFVDLNANIGGRDIDNNWTPARTRADLPALRAVYRADRVTYGRQLANVPIMDLWWFDGSDVHAKVRPEMMHDRLVAVNGHAGNMVRWAANEPMGPGVQAMFAVAFSVLVDWVARVKADGSSGPLERKVLRHKPADARDSCWGDGQPGAECAPTYARPRIVAGSPVASNILKCQLKPIDWDDYGTVTFTSEQKAQLREVFRDGVCDWSKPGVGQQPPAGPWMSFSTVVGGVPMGAEPRSVPISRHDN
ncbi:hypothetical protein E1218_28510 [Kribbella turkmenica]|uniref:DUF6351 domain-containing protein n=1 Tax=Kribbella turkmenica TaxID=2530375 RepID=A0A4R4WQN6_9ACTN|nr:DUF6351 family protein [Kribbella turkmenica]TDD17150.1 hypothetical protein E1218_28510 [Kribbella turkmenica]